MKANILIIFLTLFFLQNIFSQEVNANEERKSPVNQAGQPYVRGPITPNVGSIKQLDLDYANPESKPKKELTQDERINLLNSQIDPNEIKPGKTYLSDVEGDLTGEHETVVYGADNDAANSNKKIMPLIFIIIIIVLVVWIFIQSKNNKTTYPIEKEATKVFEPSKILSELEKLQSLRQTGVITEEEFENLKKNILNNS
jgi:hypothetical protein